MNIKLFTAAALRLATNGVGIWDLISLLSANNYLAAITAKQKPEPVSFLTFKNKNMKIKLIDKEKFDNLKNERKIVAICKDVIYRIKNHRVVVSHGSLLANPFHMEKDSLSAKELINSKQCYACAKGALLCSWIGNFNMVSRKTLIKISETPDGMKLAPQELNEIFGKEMLDNIEAAFEGQPYHWHDNQELSRNYADAFAVLYGKKGYLRGIMQYIVDCGGKFPLPTDTSYSSQ